MATYVVIMEEILAQAFEFSVHLIFKAINKHSWMWAHPYTTYNRSFQSDLF